MVVVGAGVIVVVVVTITSPGLASHECSLAGHPSIRKVTWRRRRWSGMPFVIVRLSDDDTCSGGGIVPNILARQPFLLLLIPLSYNEGEDDAELTFSRLIIPKERGGRRDRWHRPGMTSVFLA